MAVRGAAPPQARPSIFFFFFFFFETESFAAVAVEG
jgi:hypothetical protein